MGIERFEDIRAWQEARRLTQMIYQFTRDGDFSRDFGLRDQIRRAAISVMANIAEGFDRRSTREFRNFLHIALASLSETRSHLYVALDASYLAQNGFASACSQCDMVAKLIYGFIRYLSGRMSPSAPPPS